MSFLNPGDVEIPGATPLPDPCTGYDCGAEGECVSMNMTPTCVCNVGMVAVASVTAEGARQTRCVTPTDDVPIAFYARRIPDLPQSLPGGRQVETPPPPYEAGGGSSCSASGGTASGLVGLGVIGAALAIGTLRRGRRRSGAR
jgi:hypothetical protein